MLTGTLTLTLQTEDDIILAAYILQQRRLAARTQNPGTDGEMATCTKEKKPRLSSAEVLDQLKTHFQTNEFSRAQAIEGVKRIAGYSSAKTGRILRKGIETNDLHRVREGWYAFTKTMPQENERNSLGIISHARRAITEKQRSKLRTLQNNMLYLNFKAKLERLNPDKDIEQLIDRNLEPEEALNELKRRYPDLQTFQKDERSVEAEFREYLESLGITNRDNQDLIISRMNSEPLSEEQLTAFAAALHSALQEPWTVTNPRPWENLHLTCFAPGWALCSPVLELVQSAKIFLSFSR